MGKALRPATSLPSKKFIKKISLKKRAQNILKKQDIIHSYLRNLSSNFGNKTVTRQCLKRKYEPECIDVIPQKQRKTDTKVDAIVENVVQVTENTKFQHQTKCLQSEEEIRDLFYIDELKNSNEHTFHLDWLFHICDEISLEGLDGITIEALWSRMKNISSLPVLLDGKEELFWNLIKFIGDIEYYILEAPREKLIIYDRNSCVCPDTGIVIEPMASHDIYPYSMVNNSRDKGSCATYDSRNENTDIVNLTLDEAFQVYGNQLIIVASQCMRDNAIISEISNPNLELVDNEYGLLERVGRSRNFGELTQGRVSILNIIKDSRSIFHIRKSLEKKKLLKKQFFILRSLTAAQNKTGKLLHLPRFYRVQKSKTLMLIEEVVELLRHKPGYSLEFGEFKKYFPRSTGVNKIMKMAEFNKYIRTDIFRPYRYLYPNATTSEWKYKNKDKEKVLRIFQLIDPTVNVSACWDSPDNEQNSDDEFVDDEDPGRKMINSEFLKEVFLFIYNKGIKGVTLQDLEKKIELDYYTIRIAVRKLQAKNVIDSVRSEHGKQRHIIYFARCFHSKISKKLPPPEPLKLPENILKKILKQQADAIANSSPTSDTPRSFFTLPNPNFNGRKYFKVGSRPLPFQCGIITNQPFSVEMLIEEEKFDMRNYFRQIFFINLYSEELHTKFFPFIKRKCNKNQVPPLLGQILISYSSDDLPMKFALLNSLIAGTNLNILDILEGKNESVNISDSIDFEALTDDRRSIAFKISQSNSKDYLLGPSPEILLVEKTQDNIDVTIILSTRPKEYVMDYTTYTTFDKKVTSLSLFRINTILNQINLNSIVCDIYKLQKSMVDIESESSESKLGQGKIDKNTLNRILLKLATEGYIKIFKIVMTTPEKFKAQWLITHPRIELNNPLLKTLQERMKLKFFLGLDKNQKVTDISSPFDSYEATASLNILKEMSNIKPTNSYKISRKFGRLLGYQPKFVRLQLLHELLYYLIRDYQPADRMSHSDIEEVLLHYAPEEFREIPPIYRKGIDWKMFISPLPSHKGWENGWALLCDVILAIPLSLWVKLFHTSLECQELFAYMEHPIKRHYLIKDIPLEFRHVIMYKRRYLQNAVELLYRLCFIGLVQLGPQSPQMKDKIFLYVNQKATLLDTSTSAPSYHKVSPKKYKQITFNFSSRNDVEEYWCQLWTISMNTPLGQRRVMEGKSVAIENAAYKQVLLDALKPKTPEQAKINDNGEVPGDKHGAAGLDSSMWSHIKRNWLWSSKSTKHYEPPIIRKKDINLRNANIAGIQPISIKYRELMNQNRKIYLPNDIDQFEQLEAVTITKRRERASIVHRKISLKKLGSSKKKQYYDAKDKTILKKLGRTFRANWSQKEDRILLICKAASYLLSANSNKELIPFKVIRDVLHILIPKSKDKTTSACIRRILRLWKIDPVMKRIKENVNNLINFMVISKYFSPIIYHTNKSTIFKCPYTPSEITIAYTHLVSYMYQNLTSIEKILQGHLVTLDYLAPDRIDTFSPILIYTEKDNCVSTNPTSEDSIKKCVIRSVLVSFLNSSKMGQNTSYQLFKICTKYPDNLIRSAVWGLKKDQVISLNKKSTLKSSVIRSMPFQLSVSYSHMQKTTYNALTFHTIYQSYLEIIEENPVFVEVDPSKTLFRYSGLLAKNELATIWSNINYTFNIPEAAFILNPYIKDRTTLITQLAILYQQYLKDLAVKRLQHNPSQSTEAVQTEKQEPASCATEKNKRLESSRHNVSRLLISLPCLCNKKISENNEPFMKATDEISFNNYLSIFLESLITVAQNMINSIPDGVKVLQNLIQKYHRNKILDSTTKILEARVFKIGHLVREFLRSHQLTNIKECFENEFPEKNSKSVEIIRAWLEKTKINAPKCNDDVKIAPLKNPNVHHSFFKCNKPKSESDGSVLLAVRQDGQSDIIPDVEDIIEGMMLPPDQVSRRIPHISELASLLCKDKFAELTDDEKLLDELKNHFIVQYPILEGFNVENVEELKNMSYLKEVFDTKKKEEFKEKVQRYIHIKDPNKLGMLDQIKLNGGNIHDIRITEEIVTYVYNKGSTGCTGELLTEMFADKMKNVNLITIMNILIDMYILIRTGVAERIFVHNEFASIWLVETFHLSPQENHILQASGKDQLQKLRQKIESRIRSTKQMRVILMPWIRIDGTLNLPLFEKWLTLVLSYCLNHPSCPVTTIFNKFYLIKPVEIFFLLEILQDLNCLKIFMNEMPTTSLFSYRVEKISRPATILDSFKDIYVELHTLSSICMGFYLDREGIEFI